MLDCPDKVPQAGARDPRDDLDGYVFPPAMQPVTASSGQFYGDAGDGYNPFTIPLAVRAAVNAGRDTLDDNYGPPVQWADAWGMAGSNDSYSNRYLVALDEPSA